MDRSTLSTQEVAALMSVTDTTVKRWADSGALPCSKTPGGHRKFLTKDVLHFAESHGSTIPGALPAPMSAGQRSQLEFAVITRNYSKIAEVFFQESMQGDREGLLELLLYVYRHRITFDAIVDEIIRPALMKIGELWKEGKLEVNQEHRASQAITEAMVRLAPELHRKPSNGLSAVCACLEGEYHEFGLRSLSYTLEADGWKVHYIGVNTPADTLSTFITAMKPELICVSCTIVTKRSKVIDQLDIIGKAARTYGAKILLGGYNAEELDRKDISIDFIAHSVYEALNFVKDAFHLRPGPKKAAPSS
jgi:excisionase family DNA binding protein